jgi:triphosphoribosyl-dephospho-CoA synthase
MNNTQDFEKAYSIGDAVTLACLLEATAPKIGNVHRSADFADLTFYDFVVSAVVIKQVFDQVDLLSLGEIVLHSIKTTQNHVATNTNLGIILLLAPLAKAIQKRNAVTPLPVLVAETLENTTLEDCRQVYHAIRISNAGGLGEVNQGDIDDPIQQNSELNLFEAMNLAKERDSIAKQYTNGFKEFFEVVYPIILDTLDQLQSLPDALILAHLKIMSEIPDTLIARKCDRETAERCSIRASKIVNQTRAGSPEYWSAVKEFDFWLRSDGHQRNPGTSADFVAAGLFVALATGKIDATSIKASLIAARTPLSSSI